MTQYLSWYWFAALKVGFGNIISPFLIKKIAGKSSREERLFWQFLFCSLAGSSLAALLNQPLNILLMAIGCLNAMACLWQWRAIDLNLAKTSVFTYWDDIITITLAVLILGEWRLINQWTWSGIAVSSLAVFLLSAHAYKKGEMRVNKELQLCVLGYSVIWGGATFAMRILALKEIGIGSFLASWYLGSCIGAILILLTQYRKVLARAETKERLTRKDIIEIIPLSAAIFLGLSMAFLSYSYKLVPQPAVQTVYLISEAVFPTIIGLFHFREIKQFDPKEISILILALIGGLMVTLSFI